MAPGGLIPTVLCAAVAVGLLVAGYLTLSSCGSGESLVLFGVAILFVGLAIFPAGGPTVLAMAGFVAFLLVVAGLVLSHGVAGCPF